MNLLGFMGLFEHFRAPSWDGWRSILARLTPTIRELYIIAGRGSGKSMIAALLAGRFASREYPRAPGESIYIGAFGPDRKQAGITFRYILGLLQSVPELAGLIVNETKDSLELSNGVIIEVITANTAAPRGRAYALAIIEEAAFLPTEDAADPDTELLRAVRPALARVPGSLLVVIGTPYAQRGELYKAWVQWHRQPAEDRLVVAADTRTLNPLFDQREIDRAFRDDPTAARSEYGRDGVIQFRTDVSGLLTDAALASVVHEGVRELPPDPKRPVRCAFDAADGSGQAEAAVAYVGQPAALAVVRRWRPPFDPAAVAKEAADLFRRYGGSEVLLDRYAPGLVETLFREHGLTGRVNERTTSQNFLELLTLINACRVALLDDPGLLRELSRLERKPGGEGRDRIEHPPGGHDDVAAAAAAALVKAAMARTRPAGRALVWGSDYPRDDNPAPANPTSRELSRAEVLLERKILGAMIENRDPARRWTWLK